MFIEKSADRNICRFFCDEKYLHKETSYIIIMVSKKEKKAWEEYLQKKIKTYINLRENPWNFPEKKQVNY